MKQKTQHKILLIEPPFYRLFKDTYSLDRYPLSLGYLAGTITKETNWDVMVYNSDFFPQSESMKISYLTGVGFDNYLKNLRDFSGQLWNEIKSTVAEYNPKVVGISAKSQNFASACIVAKLVKEFNKQIIVIVGGPHPSMVGSDVLKCPDIDVCVKCEGEITIVELLKAIDAREEFNTIKGIIYRKDGEIVENPQREYINDLDSICFPHESAPDVLKDYDQYPKNAFRFIFATRGCPYNCFFCGSHKIWSRKVRFRSPANVIREIKSLQKKGLRSVHFDDDTFGVNRQYIKEICNLFIVHRLRIKWSCELHVNLVSEQTISLMKKAGCNLIYIGIESGNNEILKEIRKGFTIEEAFSAVNIIKKAGVELQAFFIVGFPQETEETLKDTITAMKNIKSDALIYSIFTPYPGTEAFEFCKRKGLIGKDHDVSLYNHQSPRNCFCANINSERFRIIVSEIEKTIDRKNSLNRIRKVFSKGTFWKLWESGIAESLKKSARIFLSK